MAACAALAVACDPGVEDANNVGSQADEIVDSATFDRAAATIRAIDYLPFSYTEDGCYARAYYMSMELAAVRIESNAVYALAGNGSGLRVDSLPPGMSWSYHVAPVIEVQRGSAVEATVVDPSMAPRPLSVDGWLSGMHADANVAVVLLKGAVLNARVPYERGHGESYREALTASFDDMPRFAVGEVQVACGAMYSFLLKEAQGVDDAGRALPGHEVLTYEEAVARAAPKRQKLLTRTKALVTKLAQVNKLSGSPAGFSEGTCASAQ